MTEALKTSLPLVERHLLWSLESEAQQAENEGRQREADRIRERAEFYRRQFEKAA